MIHSVPKPVAMVVSFPSNPTAQVCDLDFYRDLIAFAKKHHLWVLSDLAYAEIYFDGNPPPSILQVDGARDVAVEFTSLSKTYAMPGWRMGFAVGNRAAHRRPDPDQVLPRLRRLHPGPGRRRRRAQWPGRLHRRDPRHLQIPPRRAGRRMGRAGWHDPLAARDDVRLGAGARALRRDRLDGLLQDPAPRGRGRRRARRRLRRIRRGLRPPRPRRERAPHPPGRARGQTGDAERRRAARQAHCRSPPSRRRPARSKPRSASPRPARSPSPAACAAWPAPAPRAGECAPWTARAPARGSPASAARHAACARR